MGCARRDPIFALLVAVSAVLAQEKGEAKRDEAAPLAADEVVAVFAGRTWRYSEIRARPEALDTLRKFYEDESRFAVAVRRVEGAFLLTRLKAVVVERGLRANRIEVSQAEVEARLRLDLRKEFGKEQITQADLQRSMEPAPQLVECLAIWLDDHEKGERVFEERFGGDVSRETWEDIKKRHGTAEGLARLKAQLEAFTVEKVLARRRQVARENLLREKLIEKLKRNKAIPADWSYYDWLNAELRTARIHPRFFGRPTNGIGTKLGTEGEKRDDAK
jgi:hypothetical protein